MDSTEVQSFITEEFKERLQAEADAHHKNISSTSGPQWHSIGGPLRWSGCNMTAFTSVPESTVMDRTLDVIDTDAGAPAYLKSLMDGSVPQSTVVDVH